jgi:hypothetical protein
MPRIPAKVVSAHRQSHRYGTTVRTRRIIYNGSFDTLAFGEHKPALGSPPDDRLHFIYLRDPALEEGEAVPWWTIQ